MKITDATGSNRGAKVDENNRVVVSSVDRSLEHQANIDGRAFVFQVSQTPTGANDNFFYIKNTGTKDIVIEGFDYRVASAESVDVILNDMGTTSGGTALTPVNLNTGSSRVLTATIEAGNDITGLSGGSTAFVIHLTSTETKHYNFESDIILRQGGTLTLQANTGAVALVMNIYAFEEETA